jgi:hypothetical protein
MLDQRTAGCATRARQIVSRSGVPSAALAVGRPWGGLPFPTPAKSIVKLDERQALIELCLRKIELRREGSVFTREYLEVTRAAMLVKYLRQTVRILCRCRQ